MRSEFLKKAMTYLKPALVIAACSTNRKQDIPSFILGNCGIYAVAAAIFKAVSDDSQCNHFRKMYLEAADFCKEPAFLNCGSDELFVGRAGKFREHNHGTQNSYSRLAPQQQCPRHIFGYAYRQLLSICLFNPYSSPVLFFNFVNFYRYS